MIQAIGIILCAVVSIGWFVPAVRLQGSRKELKTGTLIKFALLYGFLYACVLIVITEITYDAVGKGTGLSEKGLPYDIFSSFFRAALLEEFFKFTGFLLAYRKGKFEKKISFIAVCGIIGLTYGIFEKAVLGQISAMVIGILFPMHLMWQYNQGAHYFEYLEAKKRQDKKKARKEILLATLGIFLFHGLWDALLDVGFFLINKDQEHWIWPVLGVIIVLGLLTFGVIYSIKTVKKVRAEAEASAALDSAEAEAFSALDRAEAEAFSALDRAEATEVEESVDIPELENRK